MSPLVASSLSPLNLLSRLFGRTLPGFAELGQDLQKRLEDLPANVAQSASTALSNALPDTDEIRESTLLITLGWVSAGLGAVALGLFVGVELRQRYKFNRRTPYDFYAHSGDERELEFGVGV